LNQISWKICTFLPGEYGRLCDGIVNVFGDALIYFATQGYTPVQPSPSIRNLTLLSKDEVCREGNTFCNDPQCNLFPPSSSNIEAISSRKGTDVTSLKMLSNVLHRFIGGSTIKKRGDVADHVPLVDDDNDRFSSTSSPIIKLFLFLFSS